MNLGDKNKDQTKPGCLMLRLHWDVLQKIVKTIGVRPAETGGAIGGGSEETTVSKYHFDIGSRNSAVTYSPDHENLNRIFKFDWNPQGIRLRGFVHSHPGSMCRPSYGDQVYAERILKAIDDLECLWLPIINTIPEGGTFKLSPWVAYLSEGDLRLEKCQVQIDHADQESFLNIGGVNYLKSIQVGVPLEQIVLGEPKLRRAVPRILPVGYSIATCAPSLTQIRSRSQPQANTQQKVVKAEGIGNTFDRVQSAYDLELMDRARIIAVGAGGAAGWLEDMGRAGTGQFVLIDSDVVSETNLATQQTYRKDIGRAKVDCIAERIRDINPAARIVVHKKSLDEISDDEMRSLALSPLCGCNPAVTVICGLTDSFFAQARVNRLALHLGIPSLCAQVYREGRGAEITFTYPGITPACHRCILSSRYRYFLEKGLENDVTSHGTPIFATTRLNAIKGFLMLALIHHGSGHPRWGQMLSRIGKRNLVQLRIDPDFSETLGLKVFDKVFEGADRQRLFFDEAVWLPQNQESPDTGYAPCPDCGGTGDLRTAIGKFHDTRLNPKGHGSTRREFRC